MNYNIIKDLCHANKMELPDLAKKIGMSVSGLYTTMNSGKMKIETLERIAETLNVSIEVFFLNSMNDIPDNNEIQNLYERMRELEYQLEEKRELISFYREKLRNIITEDLKGKKQEDRILDEKWDYYDEMVDEKHPEIKREMDLLEQAFIDKIQKQPWTEEDLPKRYHDLKKLKVQLFEEYAGNDNVIAELYRNRKGKNHPLLTYLRRFYNKQGWP